MILCCGEALIDMLPRQLEDGTSVFQPVPGGAIFNTAIALGRLGTSVGLLTVLSTDLFGDQLAIALRESRVDDRYCLRSDLPSTLAFAKLVNGQARYSFFDENSAGRSLSIDQLPRLVDDIVALHFGAVSLIPEPCGGAFESLLEREKHRVISLDPNIRVNFIEDDEKHRARIMRMIKQSDIVKVSDEDIDWISEGRDRESVITQWLSGDTKIVLLTKGDQGALAYFRDEKIEAAANIINVVDTIGAGDAFNAGFLHGLNREGLLKKDALSSLTVETVQDSLVLANQVAALSCEKAGADSPWGYELKSS